MIDAVMGNIMPYRRLTKLNFDYCITSGNIHLVYQAPILKIL